MVRVENMAEGGYPDVEGMLDGTWFGLELKAVARPALSGPMHLKVRDSQVRFAGKRLRARGLYWFFIQIGSGHRRKLYLVPGGYAQELQEGLTEREIADLSRLPTTKPTQSQVVRRAVQLP